MTILINFLRSIIRRLWRFAARVVTVIVRPPTALIKRVGTGVSAGMPRAVQRHRDRVSRDASYSRQVSTAVNALITTLLGSAPYASVAVVLLTAWLGTELTKDEPLPARTTLSDKVRDQQQRSPATDPVPLWERFPYE